MSGTTHILLGTAATICIVKPNTHKELVVATIIGALGSMIADIDTDNSKISTCFRSGLLILVVMGIIQWKYNVIELSFIYEYIEKQYLNRQLIGLFLFLLLLFFGTFTKHRHVTHSIEYSLLFCGCMYLIQPEFTIPLGIGLLSHTILDLLNYKKVRISILFKIEIAFKICSSNGIVNGILTTFGLIAMYLTTAMK